MRAAPRARGSQGGRTSARARTCARAATRRSRVVLPSPGRVPGRATLTAPRHEAVPLSSDAIPFPSLVPDAEPGLPAIIQGGMGIGVSGWKLARAVSQLGQLGVVSGTAIDTVLARRLEDGDPGGHVRRALAAFPLPQAATEA